MEMQQVQFWEGVSVTLLVVLIVIGGNAVFSAAPQSSERPRFAEIDVERINVVESDGTVKLVIANRDRAPDQVRDGQSRPRAADNKSPGITFFDDAGDEAGGLKVRGDRRVGPSAGRHLLFDQHRGDQVVGLVSHETEQGRTAGVMVWDRPDMPLQEVIERYDRVMQATGEEHARLAAEFEACCFRFGVERMFLGKNLAREATLALKDGMGRDRLRLIVPAEGHARIEFLDEQGRTTTTLPTRP